MFSPSGKTKRPCRICVSERAAIHLPMLGSNKNWRSTEELLTIQCRGWEVVKKKAAGVTSPEYKKVMDRCKSMSVHPLPSSLHKLYHGHPFLLDAVCRLTPPDELHTVLGGLLKEVLTWSTVILSCVQRVDERRSNIMEKVDRKLQSFPNYLLPNVFKKVYLNGGLSALSKGIENSSKNQAGSAVAFGGLDHQQIPTILLQLLCILVSEPSIVPTSYNWCKENGMLQGYRFSISETLINAIVTALDVHYELRREEISSRTIDVLEHVISSTRLHLLRLYSIKESITSK